MDVGRGGWCGPGCGEGGVGDFLGGVGRRWVGLARLLKLHGLLDPDGEQAGIDVVQ
jgi:hypothetical protein